MRLSLATWLRDYDKSWLRSDVIAGLTVWALVVPQAIAYAQIANLPPQAGVFAAFAAPLGYALFGTSRQLIVSPTSATAAISAVLIAPYAVAGSDDWAEMSAALAILCGLAFFLLGKLKLGFISQFIATAVQTGFLFGLGLTIIVGQLFKIFGIDEIDGPFYKQLAHFVRNIDDSSWWTAAVGLGSLAVLFLMRRIVPLVPAALVVVAASILLEVVLDLSDKGVAIVGQVDRAIPVPALPIVPLDDLVGLIPGVLAIVVIGYSESISVAQGFADKHRYEVSPNRELAALGSSSVFSGLFQSFITAGGASQSAANDRAGAKSQMAGVVLAILSGLTAIALMPLFQDLPLAVLGAIVISAVAGFLDVAGMRRIASLRGDSFVLGLLALVAVLILGILPGLLIAIALSIGLLLVQLSKPGLSRLGRIPGTTTLVSTENNPDAEELPGLLSVRLDAPLIFVNAPSVRDSVRELANSGASPPDVVFLDLEATSSLDIKSADVLSALRVEFEENGIELWLVNVHASVRDMLIRSSPEPDLSAQHVFGSFDEATEAYIRKQETKDETEDAS